MRNSKEGIVKNYLKGTLWLSFGTISSKVFVSVSYLIVARFLTPESFGKFSLLKSNVDSFLNFSSAGLNTAAIKYLNDYRGNPKFLSKISGSIILILVAWSTLVLFIFFCLADFIALELINKPGLKSGIQISSFCLFLTTLNLGLFGFYSGLKEFKILATLNITLGILYIIFISSGVIFFDFLGGIVGITVSQFCVLVMNIYFLRANLLKNGILISFSKAKLLICPILKFTTPIFLSSLLTGPILYILNLLLLTGTNGEYQLGVYNALNFIPSFLLTIISLISNSFVTFFTSKKLNLTNTEERYKYFVPLFLTIFLILFFVLFPEILSIIVGNKYNFNENRDTVIYNFLTIIIISHRQGFAVDIIKKGKTKYSILSMGQWGITSILLFTFLFERTSGGMAASIFFGYLINTFLFIPIFVFAKISPRFVLFDKYVILTYLSVFILIGINFLQIGMPIRVMLFLVVFFWFLYLFFKVVKYDFK